MIAYGVIVTKFVSLHVWTKMWQWICPLQVDGTVFEKSLHSAGKWGWDSATKKWQPLSVHWMVNKSGSRWVGSNSIATISNRLLSNYLQNYDPHSVWCCGSILLEYFAHHWKQQSSSSKPPYRNSPLVISQHYQFCPIGPRCSSFNNPKSSPYLITKSSDLSTCLSFMTITN